MKTKHAILTAILCIVLISAGFSQTFEPEPGNAQLMGGLGYTQIDDDNYFTVTIRPELAIGKIGIGLNVDLLYNVETGHIRTEDWNESYDYFRMLRYIRYNRKGDPFYTRVGALDRARIGHGFLMNYYTNETANYDKRKIGLSLDLDFGQFGFETMTSNLGRMEILGVRGYVRPLQFVTDLPIIKNLTFGATYVTDTDPDENRDTDDAVNAWGLDAELPLIKNTMLYTGLYYDWGKIVDNGNGQAFGIAAQLNGLLGTFEVFSKFERRLLGKEFLPTFFNAYYEVERYNRAENAHKVDYLKLMTEEVKGWYGELGAHVLGTLQIIGTYQWLDEDPNGLLHLQAEIPKTIPKISARATFDKAGIGTVKDISLPGSVAALGLGYQLNPWMMVYMDYIYTFHETEDGRIETQKRIKPSVAFVYNFPVGN